MGLFGSNDNYEECTILLRREFKPRGAFMLSIEEYGSATGQRFWLSGMAEAFAKSGSESTPVSPEMFDASALALLRSYFPSASWVDNHVNTSMENDDPEHPMLTLGKARIKSKDVSSWLAEQNANLGGAMHIEKR